MHSLEARDVRGIVMLVDDGELVTATEVSRDTDRYLASAASGKQFVVFSDGAPKAAIIGIDDLRRFDAMRRGSDGPAPDDIDTTGVDYRSLLRPHDPTVAPIGVYADGSAAMLTVRRHHTIIASEHSGREDLLTSAILGGRTRQSADSAELCACHRALCHRAAGTAGEPASRCRRRNRSRRQSGVGPFSRPYSRRSPIAPGAAATTPGAVFR
ncbi:hypothetical protein [Mycobacterium celatum]|nr:hypothetical protein [Mycobacterium celatum]